jgi:hypothetical protein
MAINPYDKWPQLDIKPLDFGQLMQAQQYINQAKEVKLNRDLKAYEDLSALKTTHIQMIPGSTDEARQKAIEDEEFGKVDAWAEDYSKGKIGYKDLMMNVINSKRRINSPEAALGNENFKNWDDVRKTVIDMKAKGTYSPLIHGNLLDATNFDSSKGDRWNKYPEAYQGRGVAETLYNNLTPVQDRDTGETFISKEMIREHTKKNLPVIMNEPFTQQQIQIARNNGDTRPDAEIAENVWNAIGDEFLQQKYPTPISTSSSTGTKKGEADKTPEPIPVPSPYTANLFNVPSKYGTPEEYKAKRTEINQSVEDLSKKLVDTKDVPLKQAIFTDAEYIRMPDGHIYSKQDIITGDWKGKIMDGVYEDEVAGPLQQLSDTKQILDQDNEQILKNMFEQDYWTGAYKSQRNKILDAEGNYVFSEASKELTQEAIQHAKARMGELMASGMPPFRDENGKIITYLEEDVKEYISERDPQYAKFQKAYDKAYQAYYNPDVSVQPKGFMVDKDDKINMELPKIVDTFEVYNAQGEKINPNDVKQVPAGETEITGWFTLPDRGIMVEAKHVDKTTGARSEPFFIDISGRYEQDFYMTRGLAGDKQDVIMKQLDRKFTSPTAAQSAQIYVDGKDYNIITKDGSKYIGYKDDITGKYVQRNVGVVDNNTLSNQLLQLSNNQKSYGLDKLVMGLLGAEGGKNIQNLSGSPADGYFQIIPKYHGDTLAKLGYNVLDPKFKISNYSFPEQARMAKAILESNREDAYRLYSKYGAADQLPLKELDDFMWGAYYLGATGLETWLRTFASSGLEDANRTIKGYGNTSGVGIVNTGLETYVSNARKKADKFAEEQSKKYNQ